jgi:hypothetical protein
VLLNKEKMVNGKSEDHWYPFTYKWNKAGTEADLVHFVDGFDSTYFAGDIPNSVDYVKWKFPAQDVCNQCHQRTVAPRDTLGTGNNDLGRAVLGFFPAQLSRPSTTNPAVNQITELFTKGVFVGTQPTVEQLSRRWIGMDEPLPAAVGANRSARDSVLNTMSRAYIAANCSGCHGERGKAVGAVFGPELDYDFHELKYYPTGSLTPARTLKWYEDTTMMKFMDHWLTEEFGIEGSALIRPGRPDQSIIIARQAVRYEKLNKTHNPDSLINYSPATSPMRQMPPVASYKVNDKAIAIMTEWVLFMPDSNGVVDTSKVPQSIHGGRGLAKTKMPVIQDNMLIVPEGFTGKVELISLQGRRFELRATGRNSFAIPTGLSSGVYMIRVGNRAFTRYLF